MPTIFMTGATGALGRTILPRLVSKGYRVLALVRPGSITAAKKLLSIYSSQQVIIIPGDLTEFLCGVSDDDVLTWQGKVDFILHCGASISFTDETETRRTNIEGMSHLLTLAKNLEVDDFRHVSSTYVAGDSVTFSEKELFSGQSWRNPYERSKYRGELMLRSWAKDTGMKYSIYRPSILVGCEDGTTPTFDAYYGYFRPITLVAEVMRKRAETGKELPPDVRIGLDGFIELPLVLAASNHSTLDLIPIDWVADMIVALLSKPSGNQTFHLTHPNPPLVRNVIRWSLEALRIEGVKVLQPGVRVDKALAKQSLLLKRQQVKHLNPVHHQYLPYTSHGTYFSYSSTIRALGKEYREPITIDEKFLQKLLRYATGTAWGSREFKSELENV